MSASVVTAAVQTSVGETLIAMGEWSPSVGKMFPISHAAREAS